VNDQKRPKVVIIGAGFGGLATARELSGKNVDVTVIDRTNHHLFQPLLYQVATSALSPADIAQPIRSILRDAQNVRVVMGEVVAIDLAAKTVSTAHRTFPYDYLIVAAGARHSYFGNPQWEKFAPGLKQIEDAILLRRRLLMAFENAEKAEDKELHDAYLTFVVVGAGPTGVEMSGSISELARHTLSRDFRHIDPTEAHVILVDAMQRVLPMFPEKLSAKALKHLHQLHIDVRCGVMVKNVTEEGVQIDDEFIKARTVIWAAGNEASPLGKLLEGAEHDRAGRVQVEPDLSIKGHPNVFAIGDMSSFSHQGDKPLPGVSPVALQQGKHAARNILRKIKGREVRPFKYLDKGSMATIGRNKAVADLHIAKFSGFPAWLAWLFVHLLFLVGFRNRIFVFFHWAWGYLSYGKGARLITGFPNAEPEEKRQPGS
jgi:NADH:ubiquinone reductase (H+-translocating)